MTTLDQFRCEIAWLLWCLNEGYVNAADRAILSNWLLDDPATLTEHDRELRPHLLAMADEVITAVVRGKRKVTTRER